MPLALVKTESSDRQSARLASLLARRDALHGELSRLQRPEQTRAAAQAAVAEAERELSELDRLDREAWASWASAPTGEAPAPNHEERRAAEQKRALGAADLRGSEAAVAAIAPRLAELRKVGREIYAVKLDAVLADLPKVELGILEALQAQSEGLLKLRGLHTALAEEKSAAMARNDESSAALLQDAITRIETMKQPQTASTWVDVQLAASSWRERLR